MIRLAQFTFATLLVAIATTANAALVTTNLIQHLDADTNVAATGSNVTSWAPVSGTGDTVTTSAGSPQLNTAALNGRDTISFTLDQMNGTDLTLFDFGTGGVTWFAVARPAASGTNTNVFGTLENGTGFDGLQFEAKASSLWHADFRSDGGPDAGVTEAISSQGTWNIYAGTRNGDTVELLVNGISEGTLGGYTGFSLSADALAIGAERTGGNERANFDIASLLIYDTYLTPAQFNDTGFFLADRFGIATVFTAPVPEPSTAVLMVMGLIGLVSRRKSRTTSV